MPSTQLQKRRTSRSRSKMRVVQLPTIVSASIRVHASEVTSVSAIQKDLSGHGLWVAGSNIGGLWSVVIRLPLRACVTLKRSCSG